MTILTKSNFISFLQCPRLLWLSKNRPDLKPEIDPVTQNRFDEGYKVESYAEKLFPNGINAKTNSFRQDLKRTIALITQKKKNLFQPSFQYKDLWFRGDILIKKNNKWHIYEIKSSTKAKDYHIPDLAFQKYCLNRLGAKIGSSNLILVNNQFTKKGPIKSHDFLYIENISDLVEEFMPQLEDLISQARKVLASLEEYPVKILKQCNNPFECDFINWCWRDIPHESIYDILGGLSLSQVKTCVEKNTIELKDIEKLDFKRKNYQLFWQAFKANTSQIDRDQIKKELNKLKYPLYFLDYETYNPAVPWLDGYQPYQHIVFQYSLHVIKKPGAKLEHKEYLAESKNELGEKFIASLKKDLGAEGSIVVWNEAFEKARNKELGELHPDARKFFNNVNQRIYDLMTIFKKGYYVDKEFFASSSIKAVLPVLAPELSYKELEVQHGAQASVTWKNLIEGNLKHDPKKVKENLLGYCKLDTLGMVKIWDFLNHLL